MARIRRLPEELIGKIAAGEVVERPASIVKELLENAVDAGAGDISIELAAGGTARILVRDDGGGMAADDARLAFERHATSKISSFEDLTTIGTLGFRGEALAAISAVARVELQTAERDGEGVRVFVEPGVAPTIEPISRPRGTSIEVSSLFFNVPARREYLKTAATELRRVLEVVQGYALGRPGLRFRVRHEDRELMDALPAGEGRDGARERVAQIFGPSLAEALTDVELVEGANRVWGLVGDSSTARGRRYFVFVNRRLIRDRAVMASYYRAVRDVWKGGGQFPACFLFIDLPPEEVDVNVHPQKSEVRFLNSRLLHLVYKAVKQTLESGLGEGMAPLAELEGQSLGTSPLAWRGLGERYPASGSRRAAGSVAEGASEDRAPKLAEAGYAPPDRAPIPLSGRSGEERPFRLLGQYKGTVILLEGPDGLYMVDQHVAHERILYERLRAELWREEPLSQRLIEPQVLDLSAAEAMRLAEWIPQLSECGFELALMSGETIGVISVPTVLTAAAAESLLGELARDRQGPREAVGAAEEGSLRARVLDALAASMACRGAIKMHEPLSADKMEAIVAELFAAEQPYACPHGRPTILKMSDADMERRFGRR